MAKPNTTPEKESSPFSGEPVQDAGQVRRWSWPTEVEMPVESFGECVRSLTCKNFAVWLANGMCQIHWDKFDRMK